MKELLLTSSKGRTRLFLQKYAVGFVFCTVLTLALFFTELAVFVLRCGAEGLSAPIQSIERFREFGKRITIGEALAVMLASRLVGAVFLAGLIYCAVTFTKSISLTVYSVIAIAIVPYFALDGTIRYRLPLPFGFLIGSEFILPDTCFVSKVAGEETNFPITAELSMPQILGVVLTAFFIILLLTVLQYRFYIKQSEGVKGI